MYCGRYFGKPVLHIRSLFNTDSSILYGQTIKKTFCPQVRSKRQCSMTRGEVREVKEQQVSSWL